MLTYQECLDLTKKKPTKKLENNTYLDTLEAGNFGVKLHNTYIVIVSPDETYELNSGGYRTVTTKDRINKYAPVRIWQERGIWYLYDRELFYDGILVDREGNILSEKLDVTREEKGKKLIDKMVSKYIKGFIAHIKDGKLEDPNNGDCWGCCMEAKTVEGVVSTEPFGYDHYLSHFEEEYYVPSLLWKAIRGNKAFVWSWVKSNPEQNAHLIEQDLYYFFRNIKNKLVECYYERETSSV